MANGEKFAVSPLTLCGNYRLSFLLIKENCSFGIYEHVSIKCICKTACESGIRCSRHLRAAICIYCNIQASVPSFSPLWIKYTHDKKTTICDSLLLSNCCGSGSVSPITALKLIMRSNPPELVYEWKVIGRRLTKEWERGHTRQERQDWLTKKKKEHEADNREKESKRVGWQGERGGEMDDEGLNPWKRQWTRQAYWAKTLRSNFASLLADITKNNMKMTDYVLVWGFCN